MKLKEILKNKPVAFGLGIVILVLCIAIVTPKSKKDQSSQDVSASPRASTPSQLLFTNLNDEKKSQAAEYRETIINELPIHIDSFHTSIGLSTSIDITALPQDPKEVVYLQIGGISYINPDTNPKKNPNVIAYAETYREAMRILRDKKIDPKKLMFVYSDRDYVKATIDKWMAAQKLSP
jgi:hypothetical protein